MTERNPYAPPEAHVADAAVVTEGELASRPARFFGSVVDGLVTFALFGPLLYLTGYWTAAFTGQLSLSANAGMLVAGLVLYAAINGYWLAKYGQSVGKRVVGIKIVGAADGRLQPLAVVLGARYGFQWVLNVLNLVPGLGSLLIMIDVLMIFRKDRRCLHDLVAGTKVVYVPAPDASTGAAATDRRD